MKGMTEEQKLALAAVDPLVANHLKKPAPKIPHIADLNRDKKKVVASAERILDAAKLENRHITNTEQLAFDGLMAVGDDLQARIDFLAEHEGLGVSSSKSADTEWSDTDGKQVNVYKPDDLLYNPAKAGDLKDVNAGSIMRAMVMGPKTSLEVQALSEGTDTAGGFTVPETLSRQLVDLMRKKARAVQAGAMTVELNTEKTNIARLASDPIPAWRLEDAAIANSEPTFGSVAFQARSLAVLVKVSRELLEDSVNIDQALLHSLAQSLALEIDRVALLGSGTAPEPLGLSNTVGVLEVDMGANGAALANYSPFLTAMQNIADANSSEPTAAIMAPRTKFGLAGLTATDGQPLRQPDVLANLPKLDTTQIPVDETHGTATDASRVIMGDFSQLMIGIRSGLRIELLREKFADNHQYAFVAHMRADVAVAQPTAFCQITGITP